VEVDPAIDSGRVRAADEADPRGRVWLWSSLFLTLFALIVAISLAPPGNAPPVRSLTLLLFVGSSVHVATTGYLFSEADIRAHMAKHRARYVWIPVLVIVFAAALVSIASVRDLKWFLLPYFAWQFFHFHKQNLGMVALASTSSGLRGPSAPERWALTATSLFGIGGLSSWFVQDASGARASRPPISWLSFSLARSSSSTRPMPQSRA
jgi:hypothetical protein